MVRCLVSPCLVVDKPCLKDSLNHNLLVLLLPKVEVRPLLFPPPSTSNCVILIHPVLAFLKAFRLKRDVDTIRRSVCENFSSELVESGKKALWDFCGSVLEAACFPLQIRRDSEKRS